MEKHSLDKPKLFRHASVRYGLKLNTFTGLIVYTDLMGCPVVLTSPLHSFLEALIGEHGVIQVNSPDLVYDREKVIRGNVLEHSAIGYKNGFFVSNAQQSVLMTFRDKDLLLSSLDWINGLDAWCIYKCVDQQAEFAVKELLVRQEACNPTHYSIERHWLISVLSVCSCVISSGGDGAFLDIWSTAPKTSLESIAVEEAEKRLLEIKASHGMLTYDTDINAYVLGSKNGL